jgi:hypothetical protein
MKQWGYGEGYQHAHKFEDAITGMECLPPSLAGKRYYQPTDRGVEKRIGERLEEVGEAAAVCMESQHHQAGVIMQLERRADTSIEVHWRSLPPNAYRCHTGDRATEDGACGIAILLAWELTGQVVLFRSERKEGCDYWLGPANYPRHNGLKGMSRIEVSGIRGASANFWSR